MRNKYIISLTLIGFMLVIALCVGGSYAYYQVTKNQTGVNEVASGCFDITFTDANSINLTDAYPMTDTQGLNQTPYTFTITNSCSIAANYTVTINTLDITDNITDSNIKIAINRTTATTQTVKYLTDLSINTDISGLGLENIKQSYIVESGVLNKGESITYEAYIWIDESADNSVQDKNMEAAIVITNTATEEEITYLADAIISDYGGVETIISNGTPDFTAISTDNDTGMYAIEDDYDTSYYFRGTASLLHNNVIFAEYQWKVIRINGDGSVRLIYNGECPNNSCEINTTGTVTQLTSNSAFNTDYDDNKYVGYMYGNESTPTTSYETAHANENDSTIKTVLDEWYYNYIYDTTYESYISDTLFCNDRSITAASGTPSSYYTNVGYGTENTVYSAYTRLEIKSPQLKCTNTNIDNNDSFTVNDTTNGNGALTYPIGLITADEVALAGGVQGTANTTYYLFTGQVYWTGSSYSFDGADSSEWVVGSNAGLYCSGVLYDSGVRVVVNLNSNTMVSGSGTTSDPYIVL